MSEVFIIYWIPYYVRSIRNLMVTELCQKLSQFNSHRIMSKFHNLLVTELRNSKIVQLFVQLRQAYAYFVIDLFIYIALFGDLFIL